MFTPHKAEKADHIKAALCTFVLLAMAFIMLSCLHYRQEFRSTTQSDTEAPYFVYFPADVIDTCGHQLELGEPIAWDQGADVHLAFVDKEQGDCASGLTILRTWSAMDKAGNQRTRTQRIQLLPTPKPGRAPILDDRLHLEQNGDRIYARYLLPDSAKVSLKVMDELGSLYFQFEEQQAAGEQAIPINTKQYETGQYLVLLNFHNRWLSSSFFQE